MNSDLAAPTALIVSLESEGQEPGCAQMSTEKISCKIQSHRTFLPMLRMSG
jgi:hypothetical protein